MLKTDRLQGYFHKVIVPEYRPIPLILFAIEWQFFPDNPSVYHFMNVLLYALTCWLLFLLLCKLFDKKSLLFPFTCALLYAAHPIHTDVVNSIKGSDEIICFLFAICSILLMVKYYDSGSIRDLIIGGFFFFLCLLSKENGLTFFILIPLILYFFRALNFKKIKTIVIVLASITLTYFIIRIQVLGNLETREIYDFNNRTFFLIHDFFNREATAFYILSKYILLLIFPHPLCFDYSFNQIPMQTLKDIPALISIFAIFAMGIFAVINIQKKSLVAFAILFFLISISVVSNVFMSIGAAMGERFLYIPSLGYCMFITWLLIRVIKTNESMKNHLTLNQFISGNQYLFSVVLILVGLYSIKTFSRSKYWKDNYSLLTHDVTISDKSAQTHYCLGNALLYEKYPAATDTALKNSYNNEAISEFNKTLDIFGGFPDVYASLALCYEQKGAFQDEIKLLDSAIKYYPENVNYYTKQSFAFLQIGKAEEAIIAGEKALKINPDFQKAYTNLGYAYYATFDLEKAKTYLTKASHLDPNDASSIYTLGLVYSALKDTTNARIYLEKASKMSGGQGR